MATVTKAPGHWWAKCAVAGIVGGLAMGAYEMMATALTGGGFWAPLNMIGATLPAFRPPAVGFVAGPTLSGLMLHMIASAFWGLVYGALVLAVAPRFGRTWPSESVLGLVYGVGVWIVMGLFIGPLLDPVMRMAPPVNFFIGHVVYGLVVAWVLTGWTQRRELSLIFAPEVPAERGAELRR